MKITVDFSFVKLSDEDTKAICEAFGTENTLAEGEELEEISFKADELNKEVIEMIYAILGLGLEVNISNN